MPWEVTAVRTKNAVSIHCEYLSHCSFNASSNEMSLLIKANIPIAPSKSSCVSISHLRRFWPVSMSIRLVSPLMANMFSPRLALSLL